MIRVVGALGRKYIKTRDIKTSYLRIFIPAHYKGLVWGFST